MKLTAISNVHIITMCYITMIDQNAGSIKSTQSSSKYIQTVFCKALSSLIVIEYKNK